MESGLSLLQTWEVYLDFSMKGWQGVFYCPLLPHHPREGIVRKHLSLEYGLPCLNPEGMTRHLWLLLLPHHPNVKLICSIIIHSMCLDIKCQGESCLYLLDGGVLGEGHSPSDTIVLEHLFCHGRGGALAGGVGVLSKKSQENSQEVVCSVDWLSTVRATEEPFRWHWEWAWSDCNEFIFSELHKTGFSGIHDIDMLLDYILNFNSGTYKSIVHVFVANFLLQRLEPS